MLSIEDPLRFGILGPVVAYRGLDRRELGGRRQRMVLAVLLAQSNCVVSRDGLIEAVWGGNPPPAARTSLYTYLSHLRDILGRHSIQHVDGGYMIAADSETLDVLEFTRLVETGSTQLQSDPKGAADSFDRALNLWRGPPFGDLGDEPGLVIERAHLSELRLAAEEKRVDAYLVGGRHEKVIGDLAVLIEENPFRERFQAQLMLALYRSGRQADSLRAFAEARRRFAEELGIDPSPPLWRLEERILSHDSSLLYPLGDGVAAVAAELNLTAASLKPTEAAVVTRSRRHGPERDNDRPSKEPTSPNQAPARIRTTTVLVSAAVVIGLAISLTGSPEAPASNQRRPGCAAMLAEPTAWWSGDGTTEDVMRAADATLVGYAMYGSGIVEEAFTLPGSGWVDIPDDIALDPGTADFTLDLWARFESTNREQILAEKWVQRYGAPSVGWTFQMHPEGILGFYTDGSSGNFSIQAEQGQIPIDEWIHFAVIRRSDTLELFVNGLVAASYHQPGAQSYDIGSTSSLKLGHRGDQYDTPGAEGTQDMNLIGDIDEVHLWSGTALTTEEIGSLVDAGASGLCSSS